MSKQQIHIVVESYRLQNTVVLEEGRGRWRRGNLNSMWIAAPLPNTNLYPQDFSYSRIIIALYHNNFTLIGWGRSWNKEIDKPVSLIICLLALIFLYLPSLSQAQIYKWTDGKGVVHYSNVPMDRNVEITAEVETSRHLHQQNTILLEEADSRALDAYRQELIEADIEDRKRKEKEQNPRLTLTMNA